MAPETNRGGRNDDEHINGCELIGDIRGNPHETRACAKRTRFSFGQEPVRVLPSPCAYRILSAYEMSCSKA